MERVKKLVLAQLAGIYTHSAPFGAEWVESQIKVSLW